MKATRKCFILVGHPIDVSYVLGQLQFKGLITAPYGIPTDSRDMENVFRYNKSYVFAGDDFQEAFPADAIIVTVIRTNSVNVTAEINRNVIAANLTNIADQFNEIALNHGIDIGDHKSNSSGHDGHANFHCCCCDHRDGKRSDNEPVLYRSENFFVFPGSGQFAHGYLQICPTKHVMSLGELPAEVLEEFEGVLQDVEYLLKLTFNCKSTIVWENGSGAAGVGKAKDSIVHSHVHIIPSNTTSDDVKKISGFDFDTVKVFDLPKYKEFSYLLVRTPDDENWIINNDPKLYIPRQYIRQIVAQEYNIPGELWNWRYYSFHENMRQTTMLMVNAIKKNWNDLPPRIRNRATCVFSINI